MVSGFIACSRPMVLRATSSILRRLLCLDGTAAPRPMRSPLNVDCRPSLIPRRTARLRRFRTFPQLPRNGEDRPSIDLGVLSGGSSGLPGSGHSHNATQEFTPTGRAAPLHLLDRVWRSPR
jgi:hypothetical protein